MQTERHVNYDQIRQGEAPEAWLLPQIRLWSSTELARYLGVARYTLTRRVEDGHIPATRFDGRYLFTTEQVGHAVRHHRTLARGGFDPGDRELGEPIRFEEIGAATDG